MKTLNEKIAKYMQYLEDPDIEEYARARIRRATRKGCMVTGISVAIISLIVVMIIE